jgi:hypothetical protein
MGTDLDHDTLVVDDIMVYGQAYKVGVKVGWRVSYVNNVRVRNFGQMAAVTKRSRLQGELSVVLVFQELAYPDEQMMSVRAIPKPPTLASSSALSCLLPGGIFACLDM